VVATDESVLSCVRAWHTGYRGVKHERTVTVYSDEHWVVEDTLTSKEPHTYRLHWLLPDWEWEVENRDSRFGIRIKSPLGWIDLDVTSDSQFPDNDSRLTLVRAGDLVYGTRDVQSYEGWVSPTYGSKMPALSLMVETESISNMKFLSEFIFPA
jgi:hypothetical protein